jgi:hypothetical protein
MKFAKLAAAALVAAVIVPAAAQAGTVSLSQSTDLGTLVQGSYNFGAGFNDTKAKSGLLSGYTASINNGASSSLAAINKTNTGVAFTDSFSFSLASASRPSSVEVSETFASKTNPISNIAFTLYKATKSGYQAVANSTKLIKSGQYSYQLAETYSYLKNGAYELVVTGTVAGGKVASYSGNISVNPVPLPAALPLFGSALVGFGLFGRRRKAKV